MVQQFNIGSRYFCVSFFPLFFSLYKPAIFAVCCVVIFCLLPTAFDRWEIKRLLTYLLICISLLSVQYVCLLMTVSLFCFVLFYFISLRMCQPHWGIVSYQSWQCFIWWSAVALINDEMPTLKSSSDVRVYNLKHRPALAYRPTGLFTLRCLSTLPITGWFMQFSYIEWVCKNDGVFTKTNSHKHNFAALFSRATFYSVTD